MVCKWYRWTVCGSLQSISMANLNFCTQRIKSSLVFLSIPKLILENYLDLIKIYFYMDTSHLQMFQKVDWFTQIFEYVWYILGATWWILMSRRFRICMAKGGRESARPSYGRPKWTLISRGKKIPKTVLQKTFRPQFSRLSLAIESAVFWYIWNIADSMSRLKYENCGRKVLGDTVLGFFFGSK